VQSIGLSVIKSQDINAVQAQISALLRERHQLKADGTADDFRFFNQIQLLGTLTTITR